MEYLTITGSLRLKPTVDKSILNSVISGFETINFDRQESVIIDRKSDLITINVTGEISNKVALEVIELLRKLNQTTTDGSIIIVDRVRWELNVSLICKEHGVKNLEFYLMDFLDRQESNQLILS